MLTASTRAVLAALSPESTPVQCMAEPSLSQLIRTRHPDTALTPVPVKAACSPAAPCPSCPRQGSAIKTDKMYQNSSLGQVGTQRRGQCNGLGQVGTWRRGQHNGLRQLGTWRRGQRGLTACVSPQWLPLLLRRLPRRGSHRPSGVQRHPHGGAQAWEGRDATCSPGSAAGHCGSDQQCRGFPPRPAGLGPLLALGFLSPCGAASSVLKPSQLCACCVLTIYDSL